jgi:hypothetical protein
MRFKIRRRTFNTKREKTAYRDLRDVAIESKKEEEGEKELEIKNMSYEMK